MKELFPLKITAYEGPFRQSPVESHSSSMDMRRAGVWLTGALIAQSVQYQNASKYNDDARCLGGELSRDQHCGTYRGAAEGAQRYANLGYVGAATFGVAATVLLLTIPAKGTRNAHAQDIAQRLHVAPSASGATFAYIGRF